MNKKTNAEPKGASRGTGARRYLVEAASPSNLPSWLNLVALIVVLLQLISMSSRIDIEKAKAELLDELVPHGHIPYESLLVADSLKADSLKADSLKAEEGRCWYWFSCGPTYDDRLLAMSELVRDGIALQTASGYEPQRFSTRLSDDIHVATKIVMHRNSASDTGKQDTTMTLFPSDCEDVGAYVEEAESIVERFRRMRREERDTSGTRIENHRDLILKNMLLWADLRGSEGKILEECKDFVDTIPLQSASRSQR